MQGDTVAVATPLPGALNARDGPLLLCYAMLCYAMLCYRRRGAACAAPPVGRCADAKLLRARQGHPTPASLLRTPRLASPAQRVASSMLLPPRRAPPPNCARGRYYSGRSYSSMRPRPARGRPQRRRPAAEERSGHLTRRMTAAPGRRLRRGGLATRAESHPLSRVHHSPPPLACLCSHRCNASPLGSSLWSGWSERSSRRAWQRRAHKAL